MDKFSRAQGGSHVMVLSAQGRDPTAHCKVTGSVSHRYTLIKVLMTGFTPFLGAVGTIKVSVVTYMCWRETVPLLRYSCQATAKHLVSH